ncbi:SDR family NAD(P)-dependent oxidoreductase [Chromobacterium haemolyticum]|uniref:SDR family NAD(P)-dependent oxidoreductase n=1 Tax=Chromobacterium haemolyticum TaxID=394935 RepID=UPI00131810F5|nr:SDR family NAD(P)-dependent oxidoreductase [Chromobacterium haemolyticum]QOD84586.1 SDR family NAD(P)-dependent oxidoreductase [Chromobacterium haemolyticum]BBH12581.1 3-oxoacyl-[acyl-carrier-protein] reductase FabG [Chromobacterium haemolyticum]
MTRQVAVVTGAAGGFGSAIVKSLLEVGYAVAATDVDAAGLEQLGRELGCPDSLRGFVMDVTDSASVDAASAAIVERMGANITVLVNNAGVIGRGYCTAEKSGELARRVFDVNLNGAFNATAVFSRHMARLKYGRIINIASVAGIWGAAGGSAYAASKAGLIKASESWARELGPLNICVTAIAPGICKTKMLNQFVDRQMVEQSDDAIVKSIVPVGRWGLPEDIAEVVTFLATCKTNYLNATVIPLDGGMRVGTL